MRAALHPEELSARMEASMTAIAFGVKLPTRKEVAHL
jgi:hypothetical protein